MIGMGFERKLLGNPAGKLPGQAGNRLPAGWFLRWPGGMGSGEGNHAGVSFPGLSKGFRCTVERHATFVWIRRVTPVIVPAIPRWQSRN
jgi:hypothetical protein